VLVHCGAGVSRSASLCIAYLMRRFAWNAARARKHCQSRRSLVNPNDGFWRSLCAFEQVLGITDRSALIVPLFHMKVAKVHTIAFTVTSGQDLCADVNCTLDVAGWSCCASKTVFGR